MQTTTPANDYQLIFDYNSNGLSSKVKEYLNNGWVLFGLPIVSDRGLYQAVIKIKQ